MFSCFVLLISAGSSSFGQDIDTAQRTGDSTVHYKSIPKDWRAFLKEKSLKIDSFKRREFWEREIADTLTINEALSFLRDQKADIDNFRASLINAGLGDAAVSVDTAADSGGGLTITLNDSLDNTVKTRDTVAQIEDEIQRLLLDIDYLYSSTIQLKEEAIVVHDSTNTNGLFAKRMLRVMQKNLVKDGSGTPIFDFPSWGRRFLILLLSLFYFNWVFRLGRKGVTGRQELNVHKNQPVYVPVLKSIILFLILLPFSSSMVPVWALEGSYLLIFILLYGLLYQELSQFKKKVMNIVFLYYFFVILSNLFLSEVWWIRLIAGTANLAGVVLLWSLGRKTDVDNPIGYLHNYIRWALLLCNVVAIVLNGLEYLNISRMWSLVGAIGLLQALSLRAFRDMLLHDLEKQYSKSSERSWIKRLDKRKSIRSLDVFIGFCCTILILVVLMNNLHMNREAWGWVDRILGRSLRIGKLDFSFGDLLLVITIFWVANWFQKNLGELLSSSPTETTNSKIALLPIFRLLVVVVALLICFSIIGLGLDRLAVIIGALSVGIGLGLQNIVNNFVSGIILIFEKPFKIGDYVELADKKGQVVQIGIRSSTLLTDQGARVIIPNGDLLSGRLVNWTFSESDIRLNMQLSLESSQDIQEWKVWLARTVRSFDEVDADIPLKIWIKDLTADSYLISLQIGIQHVQYIERFRSKFLEVVKREAVNRNTKVSSS